jgi:hypothetical protein
MRDAVRLTRLCVEVGKITFHYKGYCVTNPDIPVKAAHAFRTFDFRTTRTFVHYKFSPLIRLSYAEFELSYTSDEQTFRAIAQWHCKTEPRTYFVTTNASKADSTGRAD